MTKSVNVQTGTIARSAGTVSFAVLVSRILGLIREQVFAWLFGAGFAYDAYVVAFRIPNLLRDLFAEGALSAAFVTVFTDYKTKQDAAATWKLANNVIAAIIVVVGAITLAGMLFSGSLVSFMAPKFALVPGKRELTTVMTSIMFPFLLLVSLSAVAMGILNSLGKFFIPSMASSFFQPRLNRVRCPVLICLLFFQAAAHYRYGSGHHYRRDAAGRHPAARAEAPGLQRSPFILQFKDAGLKRVMKLMLPAIIGLSATQINLFINTFFASSCPEGSVSWLNYAFRLIMFPIGVVGVSLSIATLPVVSVHASRGDIAQLRDAYVSSTVLSFLLTIPASVGLIFLATPIVRLIFEHGRFTAFDTMNTARALALYSAGLFAYASLKIIVPVFYALNKPRFPVIGSFITVCFNFIFVILTLKTLEHRAIALSMSISVIANFLFLSAALYREIEGYNMRYLIASLIKIVVVSVAMGAGALWLHTVMAQMAGTGVLAQLFALLAAMAGAGVILLCCYQIYGD